MKKYPLYFIGLIAKHAKLSKRHAVRRIHSDPEFRNSVYWQPKGCPRVIVMSYKQLTRFISKYGRRQEGL